MSTERPILACITCKLPAAGNLVRGEPCPICKTLTKVVPVPKAEIIAAGKGDKIKPRSRRPPKEPGNSRRRNTGRTKDGSRRVKSASKRSDRQDTRSAGLEPWEWDPLA